MSRGEGCSISDKGGKGAGQILKKMQERKGGLDQFQIKAYKGAREGVWTPPFSADIICEQPLNEIEVQVKFVVTLIEC